MTDTALEEQMRKGTVAAAAPTSHSGGGVAVRAGSPPDISTERSRRRCGGESIATWIRPGAPAGSISRLCCNGGDCRPGAGRNALWRGYAAEAVARARRASSTRSARSWPSGVTLAGPLAGTAEGGVYSAGVAARASAPDAAKMFLAFLRPPSRAKFTQSGSTTRNKPARGALSTVWGLPGRRAARQDLGQDFPGMALQGQPPDAVAVSAFVRRPPVSDIGRHDLRAPTKDQPVTP
jgi:hypothetical protein